MEMLFQRIHELEAFGHAWRAAGVQWLCELTCLSALLVLECGERGDWLI